MSLPQEIKYILTGINSMVYCLYIHGLSDELEQATFFTLIVGVSHFPISEKNFPQSHLVIIKKYPENNIIILATYWYISIIFLLIPPCNIG